MMQLIFTKSHSTVNYNQCNSKTQIFLPKYFINSKRWVPKIKLKHRRVPKEVKQIKFFFF